VVVAVLGTTKTAIEYNAPPGITVPDPTEFTYDDAGNRTSMTGEQVKSLYGFLLGPITVTV
jgi:hypothetical protein